ncbi:S-type pyocin domain-containing protein [Pseudomonas sp. SWRI81]|uniref:S-type pyocin domain-containing protein n=1 Tax=Pseudomonas sp. SWRI81 TaxID=2745505 RepID=UPI0016469DC5|nr:S-type pyocin domain-containing protein [Pseudomonas sp. SWRI81]MBC3272895.1 S-type pyocin domain-containing protein [Pseudomonas sp. SWRI81]
MSNQNWRPGQPVSLDVTEVNPYEKQTYSEFGNGGEYRETSRLPTFDISDVTMARTFKNMIIGSLPARYEKARRHLDDEYKKTLQTIETDINSELTASGHSNEGLKKTVQAITRDKTIVTSFIQIRYAQLLTAQQQANEFSGNDPLTLNHEQLKSITTIRFVNDPAQFDQSAAYLLKTYASSAQAAYKARLLTTAIQILQNKSNSLDAYLASLHAQELARLAAQQEAERRAQIATQQQAHAARAKSEAERQAQAAKARAEAEHQAQAARVRAKAEDAARIAAQIAQAEHEAREEALWKAEQTKVKEQARRRDAAKQAARRRKQAVASKVAAEFDSMLGQFIQNRPEGIDEQLGWLKDKYQKLYTADRAISKAESDVGDFYRAPGSGKRWSALNNIQEEIKELTRQKYNIDKVQIPLIDSTGTAGRSLVITADGLISGFEGSPFSFGKALDSLNGLRTALAKGPVSAFLASVFYIPTLGNGELQRNPIVLTIPLSQFYPEREYSPLGRSTLLYWLRHRVLSSAKGEHTQLYLESPKKSFGVRVRQASLDSQTKLYTFTTEGLIPITLTWAPASPPGVELLNNTDLPATDPGIRIYPGARVTQIQGRVDEHPSCDFDDPDDYILEFPIESGIESIYMMATRGGPRYEPGTATGTGQGVGNNWLGSAAQSSGSPVPAQIADQLRGQEFRDFGRFRESFWKTVAADELLRRQFGKVDLQQMANGAAPYADPLETVGGREKFEIHHNHRIADGGEVYDLENLRILTPKAHIELHKKGTPQ